MLEWNESEVTNWLRALNLGLRGRRVFLPGAAQQCLRIEAPRDATRLMFLAYLLLLLSVEDEHEFPGALIWNELWDNGDSIVDQTGVFLWDATGAPDGSLPGLGRYFDATECTAATASAFIAFAFQWDCCIVSHDGEYFIHKHHDEVVYIIARNERFVDKVFTELAAGDWHPTKLATPDFLRG
jgi:hypothetical protein